MKVNVLYFNSEHDAKFERVDVEEGTVKIEDKQFVIDQAEPLLLHRTFGVEPLYILKWNTVEPSYSTNPPKKLRKKQKESILDKIKHMKGSKNAKNVKITKGEGKFENVDLVWNDKIFKKYGISPEILRKMMGMKILGNMIKVKKRKEMNWVISLIIGILIGAVIVYYMVMYHVI